MCRRVDQKAFILVVFWEALLGMDFTLHSFLSHFFYSRALSIISANALETAWQAEKYLVTKTNNHFTITRL